MPAFVIFSLNSLLVASGLLGLLLRRNDRVLSYSLLRSILALPLLVAQYLYLGYALDPETAGLVLLSEAVFAVTWAGFACRLGFSTKPDEPEPIYLCLLEAFCGGVLCGLAWLFSSLHPLLEVSAGSLRIPRNSPETLFAFVVLLSTLLMTWRAERFWRNLEPQRRWEYKFLIVSIYMISSTLIWAGSYRLTYFEISDRQLLVVALLLTMGWVIMFFATARYRLLNRKVFISRKVVHASVAPVLFGSYLMGLGMISLLAREMGWPVHILVLWFLIGLGFASTLTYAFSGQLRRRVHHFISTHFYVNKYEYRDEWLALSGVLQGEDSEDGVADAAGRVLSETLYTKHIVMWIGDAHSGYRRVASKNEQWVTGDNLVLTEDDVLLRYFKEEGPFTLDQKNASRLWNRVAVEKAELLKREGVVLVAPIVSGDQVLGLIGLGEEYTGGRYGLDDFDLLAAVGAQTASALLAVRRAGELAELKQKEAFGALSAFMLHDIKNAATMLSLVHQNAADHIGDPEFQQDLLQTVADVLKRMGKVQKYLLLLAGEPSPKGDEWEICSFLEELAKGVIRKYGGLWIDVDCGEKVTLQLDRELLTIVMENVLLNSLEASREIPRIRIEASRDLSGRIIIEIEDNGPGVAPELLPHGLFQPFKSTKPKGTGVGLWQTRVLLQALGGTIQAVNRESGGAKFTVVLPGLSSDSEE